MVRKIKIKIKKNIDGKVQVLKDIYEENCPYCKYYSNSSHIEPCLNCVEFSCFTLEWERKERLQQFLNGSD